MPLSPIRDIFALEVTPLAGKRATAATGEENIVNLDFAGDETQHATHGIHTYLAAINPPLARWLIEKFTPPTASILDPFCGGGGVLVETILSGRQAIGYDINPLAVLISKAKTTYVPSRKSLPVLQSILSANGADSTASADIPEVVQFWYRQESLADLARLRNRIARIDDEKVRTLMQVALSATARDVMLTYRGEIRLRKLQGKDLERFRPNVLNAFKRRAEMAIGRASLLPQTVRAHVSLKDARTLPRTKKFHSVITSPPYADDKNGVGYFQFSRNMLFWLGFSLDDLKQQRTVFLGCNAERPQKSEDIPSTTLQSLLPAIRAIKATQHDEALRFYGDYYAALSRIASVARERVIIVIGDRVLARTKINNGHITSDMMATLGFHLEHYYSRQLRKKRISNLGTDGGGTSVEHILICRRD